MKHISFPLKCDECGTPITEMKHAMVEWIDDNQSISEVRVVHNPSFSPNDNCYKHTNEYHRQDNHLDQIMSNEELKKKLNLS